MDAVFTKLNYKEGLSIHVLNSPEVFEIILKSVSAEIPVLKEIIPNQPIGFIIVFGTSRTEFEMLAKIIAPALQGDAIFWLAYPKGTSKKYTCDFNRDTSWAIMEPYSMLPVRQVSIDDDWSALRFRKAEYIKNLTRKM